ncbi:uncharacterized protein LOC118187607 isoform X4 [Stegodyphus dumicola]|uniref:uncharacterized protein LOC118187607 isoform X4 n=1 Tax=Stegodyphus dumicola TaxID=202533 RepID=UPI0015ABD788|nr:uncharacterized protein LOC118187607 isoform X4 [Stegodyphus dumicola]
MMLMLLFMILYLGKANLANEHLCGQGSFEICAKPDTFPVSLPENEDDLDKICPFLNFIAVSENAKCLKIIIQEQNSTCYEATERALELYSEMTKKTTEEADSVTVTEESDENWNSYVCFFHVYDISCLVADADKRCGSAAKHVVLEMVRRIAYFEWICPPNILKELPSIVELLELEEEEKILLRDILPKE